MRGALLRYRVMAYIVGVGLAIVVFVGIPMQVAGNDFVAKYVGTVHGYLYIVYLIAALDLFRRARITDGRLSAKHLLAMVCAGFVPVLAFVAERWITHTVERADPARLPRVA